MDRSDTNRGTPLFTFPLLLQTAKHHIPILIGIAVAARLAMFRLDEVIFSWRSTDMASIALNYYRNGFHFLYPQVFWGGNGPGYVEMECPIIPFLLALLYRLFGVQDWLALVIPVTSGVGLVVTVYLFTRHLFDPAVGFVAGLFTATSPPLVALSTALWPDPPMVFFGALGLYLIVQWVETNKWGYFVFGASAITIAILLKLTALYLGIPLLYLCYVKYGSGLWKSASVWLLAFLILILPCLWYIHAHTLYREYHNTFGILSGGFLKFATAEVLLDPGFYGKSLGRMIFYHFTPLVFVVFILGIMVSQRDRLHYTFHVWAVTVLLYFLVAARGVSLGHFQYMLPVVPPGAALAGYGTLLLLRKLESVPSLARWPKGTWALALALLYLGGTVVAAHVYQSPEMYTTKMWAHDKRTGLAVGRLTAPGSLIVVVDNQMGGPPDGIMTPPNVFYFSDRRGWYLAMSWLTEDLIEQKRREGARYLVITANTVATFEESCPQIQGYLTARYVPLLDSEEGLLYDLAPGKEGATKSDRPN